jgi:hypothetical protein
MLRTLFCIWAAIVAGFGGAVVLGLGTAAVSAAVYKSDVQIGESVAPRVQGTLPVVKAAAVAGFGLGAGTIVWMFIVNNPRRRDPEETGPEARSEV